jgi:hypothetical protein
LMPPDLEQSTGIGTTTHPSWTANGTADPTSSASPGELIPKPHTWCMR